MDKHVQLQGPGESDPSLDGLDCAVDTGFEWLAELVDAVMFPQQTQLVVCQTGYSVLAVPSGVNDNVRNAEFGRDPDMML